MYHHLDRILDTLFSVYFFSKQGLMKEVGKCLVGVFVLRYGQPQGEAKAKIYL